VKRVGNLFQKIISLDNLFLATKLASRGNKKYKPHIARFLFYLERELLQLHEELQSSRYMPGPYRVFTIFDPKKRLISVAPFRDRVVYHAMCNHIGPILDRSMIPDSYACRKGKGMHRALKRAKFFIQKNAYFLKIDIAQFFPSVDHNKIKFLLSRKIKDPRVLDLISKIVDNVPPHYSQGKGLPIGNLTSQHFANYFLTPLDHHIKENLRIKAYLRYMDDLLLAAKEKVILWKAYQEIDLFLRESLGLYINFPATHLAPVSQGAPFLGFKIYPEKMLLQKKNWKRFKDRYLQRARQWKQGEISSEKLVQSIASMEGFLAIGNTYRLRKKFFENHSFEV